MSDIAAHTPHVRSPWWRCRQSIASHRSARSIAPHTSADSIASFNSYGQVGAINGVPVLARLLRPLNRAL